MKAREGQQGLLELLVHPAIEVSRRCSGIIGFDWKTIA